MNRPRALHRVEVQQGGAWVASRWFTRKVNAHRWAKRFNGRVVTEPAQAVEAGA